MACREQKISSSDSQCATIQEGNLAPNENSNKISDLTVIAIDGLALGATRLNSRSNLVF